MAIDFDYTADVLFAMSSKLKEYDSLELQMVAMTLTNIGAEIRKLAPSLSVVEKLNRLKPAPEKFNGDGGVKIPVPTPPAPKSPPTVATPVSDKMRAAMQGRAA
jgi:hypothetical protein